MAVSNSQTIRNLSGPLVFWRKQEGLLPAGLLLKALYKKIYKKPCSGIMIQRKN
jgi:hypothetical protein